MQRHRVLSSQNASLYATTLEPISHMHLWNILVFSTANSERKTLGCFTEARSRTLTISWTKAILCQVKTTTGSFFDLILPRTRRVKHLIERILLLFVGKRRQFHLHQKKNGYKLSLTYITYMLQMKVLFRLCFGAAMCYVSIPPLSPARRCLKQEKHPELPHDFTMFNSRAFAKTQNAKFILCFSRRNSSQPSLTHRFHCLRVEGPAVLLKNKWDFKNFQKQKMIVASLHAFDAAL